MLCWKYVMHSRLYHPTAKSFEGVSQLCVIWKMVCFVELLACICNNKKHFCCLLIWVWCYVTVRYCFLLLCIIFFTMELFMWIYSSGFVYLGLFTQTDGSVPNTLVIANCEVVKPRVAAAEHISQVIYRPNILFIIPHPPFFLVLPWRFDLIYWVLLVSLGCLISQFNEEARSPFVKKFKTIIHPGEVLVAFK